MVGPIPLNTTEPILIKLYTHMRRTYIQEIYIYEPYTIHTYIWFRADENILHTYVYGKIYHINTRAWCYIASVLYLSRMPNSIKIKLFHVVYEYMYMTWMHTSKQNGCYTRAHFQFNRTIKRFQCANDFFFTQRRVYINRPLACGQHLIILFSFSHK